MILTAGAVASGLEACAQGQDTSQIQDGLQGASSTSGGGNTSSSGGLDATTSSSSGTTSSSGSSGSNYGDDTTNPNPVPDSSDDGGMADEPTPVGPTCTAGQACVDSIPSGWNGFVQLLVNDQGVDAGCAGPYDTLQPSIGGQTNPDGGPATCGTCDCTAPDSGTGCSVDVGTGNLGCLGASPTMPAAAGTCFAVPFLSNLSGDVGKTPTATGSCVAGTANVTAAAPTPTYSVAVACGMSGDGGGAPAADGGAATGTGTTCAYGQACAPVTGAVDSGMPSGVCIYQAGVQTCPPSGTTLFTNTFVVGAVEDSRGCGCTCGSMTCPTDGVVNVYNANGCSGTTSSTLALGAGCKTGGVSGAKSAMYVQSKTGKAPTCGAGTAAPTGTVDIDGGTATTFCCIP